MILSLLQALPDALAGTTGAGLPLSDLAARLLIDLACVAILIRGIYYRHYRRGDLFLTFFAFNLVIFLIAYLLNRVEMTMGAAFGLFAVFSMLRYRTEGISIKDMTYLFLVIAIGLVMAIGPGGWMALSAIGVALLVFTAVLEGNLFVRREMAQDVWYDNIALIREQARAELIEDLRVRTGLNIHRVDVTQVDFLRDAAKLVVYYHP